METILSIEEESFNHLTEDRKLYGRGREDSFDGYIITTDKQTIKVGITNDQNCCESWGYLTTNDSLNDFIGADLLEVKIVDTALNVQKMKEADTDYAGTMFVNFETSKGTMQLVAYNDHNGYYGHDAVVISEQLIHEETL